MNKYDVLIVDSAFLATLIVAEKFDIPVVALSPGVPGGVGCIQDKWPVRMHELFILKPFFVKYWSWFAEKRSENNLPDIDYQGQFITTEYSDRFPMIIPTSPSLYPKPHPGIEHIYIGGLRNEHNLPKISHDLLTWIDKSDLDIIYISLGTHTSFEAEEITDLVAKIKAQNRFRFIWPLGIGLQKVAESAGLLDEKSDLIYLSDYLPQYAILGHPRVKVFVSHCGLGAMVDLVARKIPGVLMPQYSDQFSNAAKLEDLGAGVQLNSLKFELLIEAIEKVIKNYNVHRQNLDSLHSEFSEYENEEAIDNFVAKIASRKKLTMLYELPYQVNCPRYHYGWKIAVVSALLLCLFITWSVFKFTKLVWKKVQKRKAKPKTS